MNSRERNASATGCDLQRIQDFLESDHYHLEESALLSHLDVCPSCRDYLEAQAGEPERWVLATKLLQTYEFDQASKSDFSAATWYETGTDQPVAAKDVLDSLVASEYPNHLGRLGAYEITGVIGVGGMGVVLKAIDTSLDRVVAVKVMSPKLAHIENARKRFAREAKAAAAVLHPNVIPIHSVSSGATLPFLVMSYIRGGSLQKRLEKDGSLPLVEVLRIGSQIAAGLAAAHEQGLIHRDIKPENILLEEGVERVTITDFGLARSVDDNTVTQLGTIAGTPQYMSPEQARGEQLDQKSDLFSLGSVLYVLSTGRPPYVADSSYGVMRKIVDESAKSIHEINPAIPDWFARIVQKLMAKDKADRFQTAGEVHRILEACLSHVQQPSGYELPTIPHLLRQPVQSNAQGVPLMIKFAAGMITMAILAILVLPFAQKQRSIPAAPDDNSFVATDDLEYGVPDITVELAERLTGKKERVTFSKATSLEPEVAAILAKHPGNLSLPEVNQLTAEAAKALVSDSKNVWLVLDGLNEISPEVARELAAAKCALRLGVNTLTPEVAGILATKQEALALGLKSISPDVAKKLSMHDGWLSLEWLKAIDAESAAELAKHNRWLSLDGLESLTSEVAEALGTYDGDKLDLNGLMSLELDVAKGLSKAKCSTGIYFNSLTKVSPDVIMLLANGNSDLSFQGLEFLDSSCEQALDDADRKLRAMGKQVLRRESDQPWLMLDSHHQEGSLNKGESLSLLWKLRGQSVGIVGVRAMHVKDGKSHVVSEGEFAVDGQKSIDVQVQLKSVDEIQPENANVFVPSISVVIDGITSNANQGERFMMQGGLQIYNLSMSGQCNLESDLMRAASMTDAMTADRVHPETIAAMIKASRKGVDYFTVVLTWQKVDEVKK